MVDITPLLPPFSGNNASTMGQMSISLNCKAVSEAPFLCGQIRPYSLPCVLISISRVQQSSLPFKLLIPLHPQSYSEELLWHHGEHKLSYQIYLCNKRNISFFQGFVMPFLHVEECEQVESLTWWYRFTIWNTWSSIFFWLSTIVI